MNDRSLFVLLICLLGVIPGAPGGRAQAAPLSMDAAAISAPAQSLMKKTGQGCGWDYPCPPVPDYGRRFERRAGDIYIHNNYGPVNVYVRGRRPAEETVRPPQTRACEPVVEGDVACDVPRGCGGYPCDEKCGALCWMRRFKKGYCGHGCLAYLEQSRIAAEERAKRREEMREEAARREAIREEREARDASLRGCYDRACPAPRDDRPCYERDCPAPRYERPWREEAHRGHERPAYERPRQDSLTPREPFAGPDYRGTCTDGSC
jgi:hypothetical protein